MKNGDLIYVKKASGSQYGGINLFVSNVYSKNGSRCVDLIDKDREPMIFGLSLEFVGKARYDAK